MRNMSYVVGQTIEVCLEFDLSPAWGIRSVVGICENQHSQRVELSDVPARMSECILQKPTQTVLQGRAAYPGVYELRRLRVEHLRGVTHVEPPAITFEVRDAPKVVGWRLA